MFKIKNGLKLIMVFCEVELRSLICGKIIFDFIIKEIIEEICVLYILREGYWFCVYRNVLVIILKYKIILILKLINIFCFLERKLRYGL